MTDQKHPLTLQDIADLSKQRLITADLCDDMRAAYDLGHDDQLEQVVEWLKDNLKGSYYLDSVIKELLEAMRPQEDNS